MSSVDWVRQRYDCSLERTFLILKELLDSDVKSVESLNRPAVKFTLNTSATGKLIVIRECDLGGIKEGVSITFFLENGKLNVTKNTQAKSEPIMSAVPRMNQEGECLLEVDGESLQLWQFSRKALEPLFFGF